MPARLARILAATACAILAPAVAAGQDARLYVPLRLPERPVAIPAWQAPAPSNAPLVFAGVLGAVAGVFAGATIGYHLERGNFPCNCDDPGLTGLIFGGVIGPMFAVPAAVHMANGSRGPFSRALGASAAAGGFGLAALLGGAGEAGLFAALVAPLAEVALTVRIYSAHNKRAGPGSGPGS